MLEAPYTEAVGPPLTRMHELERTSLRIVVVVVALLTKRVGNMLHSDVEIAGGGGQEDEGEEERLFSNGVVLLRF